MQIYQIGILVLDHLIFYKKKKIGQIGKNIKYANISNRYFGVRSFNIL